MRIVLVGGGALGLNVAGIVRRLPAYELCGFIDKKPGPISGIEVLGDDAVLDQLHDKGVRHVVVCIGESQRRMKIARDLRGRGFELPPIIHPSADLGIGVDIADGCIVFPGVVVLPEVRIDEFSIVEAGAFLGHHTRIGDGALIGARAIIGNEVTMDGGVVVGMGAAVRSGSHVLGGTRVADFQCRE